MRFLCIHIIIPFIMVASGGCIAQEQVSRIEFNSGTRTFRQQIILTKDSVLIIEENFRTDVKPQVSAGPMSSEKWKNVLASVRNIALEEVEKLESPSNKRTYDAAAHGSIILTTLSGKSYTHGFDDTKPNKKLQPLMKQILSFKKD